MSGPKSLDQGKTSWFNRRSRIQAEISSMLRYFVVVSVECDVFQQRNQVGLHQSMALQTRHASEAISEAIHIVGVIKLSNFLRSPSLI